MRWDERRPPVVGKATADPLNAVIGSRPVKADIAAALRTGERAWALNPNDTGLMGEYGYRLALAESGEGCRLVLRAREWAPGPSRLP